jgi:NAD(P)-dependent dehydrogenase (short-subunit alcohol dehydrogenase family)
VTTALSGRVAVIVGAAGGIGAATARRLAAVGAQVVLADLDLGRADRVAAQIRASGGLATGVAVDVADESSVQSLMKEAVDRFGAIDMLHNNAASLARVEPEGDGDAVSINLDKWDSALRINLRGMLLGCRHAIPVMLRNGGGAIVNTASVSGVAGEAARVAYTASKAGVLGLTRHVALRWGRSNIRCNAVAPGLTLTETALTSLTPSAQQAVLQRLPRPRLATPDDIAHVVAFLLSPEAFVVQGQILLADGGQAIAGAYVPAGELAVGGSGPADINTFVD